MADEMEEITTEFVTESLDTLDSVDPLFIELEAKGQDQDIVNKLFRSVHTIKGAAGFLGFQQIVDVAHGAEDIMKKVRDGEIRLSRPVTDAVLRALDMLRLLLGHIRDKDGAAENTGPVVEELRHILEAQTSGKQPGPKQEAPAPETAAKARSGEEEKKIQPEAAPTDKPAERTDAGQTLRVSVDKIDRVMDETGEVVLARNRLLTVANRLGRKYPEDRDVQGLVEASSFLDLVASDIQLSVMKMRMQPIEKVFSKFPRMVRDLSGQLGKEVDLHLSGEDTEVDKTVIEQIGDPLVHIIRNSIDHGIETREDRKHTGKPERASVSIGAHQKGSQIIITVSDDGRGIDIEKVKKKAVSKGQITAEEAARMSDDEAVNLIFLPGLSTAEVATELSGRGVGMDVVKTNVAKLNGSVEVMTSAGHGTTFSIKIPLTLAIIQTLMVRAGELRYAVPLAPVEETIMLSPGDISDVAGIETIIVREKVYPLFRLSSIIGNNGKAAGCAAYAVIVSIGDKRFCIGVDGLLGQEEVVIKSVPGVKAQRSHVLGATITGDGTVVFILDLASIAKDSLGSVKA